MIRMQFIAVPSSGFIRHSSIINSTKYATADSVILRS